MEECEGGIEDCGSADEGHPQPTGPPWPLPPPLHHCWPKDIWKQVHIVLQKQSTLFSLFKLLLLLLLLLLLFHLMQKCMQVKYKSICAA